MKKTLLVEPFDVYRAKAAENLSSHALGDFRASPDLYCRKSLGLVPDRDSKHYKVGRAAHALVLEGREAFRRDYTVGSGPINDKTGNPYGTATKAYSEWATAQAGEILTESEGITVETVAASVKSHPFAAVLIDGRGQAEGVARARYCGEPCQIRFDYLRAGGDIVDFKTCRDIERFEYDAAAYGYINQLAFYRSVAMAAGVPLSGNVYLIASETDGVKNRTGVWRAEAATLDAAEEQNRIAIANLQACRATDSWPTGFEELRTLTSSKKGTE